MNIEVLTPHFEVPEIGLEHRDHSYQYYSTDENHHVHGPECDHDHEEHNLEELFLVNFRESEKRIENSNDIVYQAAKIAVVLSLPSVNLSHEQRQELIRVSRTQGDHPYPFFKTPEEVAYNKKRDETKKQALFDHKSLLENTSSRILAQNLLEQVQVPFDEEAQDNFLSKEVIFNLDISGNSKISLEEKPENFSYLLNIDGQQLQLSVTDSLRILAIDFALEVSRVDIALDLAEKVKNLAKILRDNDVTFSNFRSDNNIHVKENNLKIPEGHSLQCIETKTQNGDIEGLKEFTKENGEDTNGLHGELAFSGNGEIIEELCESHMEMVTEQMELVNQITENIISEIKNPNPNNFFQPPPYFFYDGASKDKRDEGSLPNLSPDSNDTSTKALEVIKADVKDKVKFSKAEDKKEKVTVVEVSELQPIESLNLIIENPVPLKNNSEKKEPVVVPATLTDASSSEGEDRAPVSHKILVLNEEESDEEKQEQSSDLERHLLKDTAPLSTEKDIDLREPDGEVIRTKNISLPVRITRPDKSLGVTSTNNSQPEIFYINSTLEYKKDVDLDNFSTSTSTTSTQTVSQEFIKEQETGTILERTINVLGSTTIQGEIQQIQRVQSENNLVTNNISEQVKEAFSQKETKKEAVVAVKKDVEMAINAKVEEVSTEKEEILGTEVYVEDAQIVIEKVEAKGKKTKQRVEAKTKSRRVSSTVVADTEEKIRENFVSTTKEKAKLSSKVKSKASSQAALSLENSFAATSSQVLQPVEPKKRAVRQARTLSNSSALALDSNNILDFSNPYAVKTAITGILQKLAA